MLQQHRAKNMVAGKSIRPTDSDVRLVPEAEVNLGILNVRYQES
jgi:hypothetical protein